MSLKAADCCSTRETGSRRPCVLLIDDEESVRVALMRYFARRGWDVCEAEDGEEARRMLSPNVGCEYDLVICDLRMPRCSGPDLYRWLLDNRPDAVREAYAVSTAVNRTANDSPKLIERWVPSAEPAPEPVQQKQPARRAKKDDGQGVLF